VIRIRGVERLHGAEHRIMPDRIETGTFLCAAAATGGDVRLTGTSTGYLDAVDRQADGCRLRHRRRARRDPPQGAASGSGHVSIRTSPYPAFPTDMQAQFMAINCGCRRHGSHARDDFRKPLHACRRTHPPGRDIKIDGNTAFVKGGPLAGRHRDGHRSARLGQPGHRRSGGQGETLIERIYHLDRGYEHSSEKLAAWAPHPREKA
jgi:UDP-N-acetylglucosamine 1-carboxyvinyltransferase